MTKQLLLIGGGGHCKVVIDTLKHLKGFAIKGIIDLPENVGHSVSDIPIIGTDDALAEYFANGYKDCFITMGSTGDPSKRLRLFKTVVEIGFSLPSIIHPSAVVSDQMEIGDGSFIAPGAVINAGTTIGKNCIINTGAVLDHDCVIEDHVHIATGAVLSGGVEVHKLSHIGSGSVLLQYLTVGEKTLIGAGSVVTRNIESNVVAYGNPCKVIRKNV